MRKLLLLLPVILMLLFACEAPLTSLYDEADVTEGTRGVSGEYVRLMIAVPVTSSGSSNGVYVYARRGQPIGGPYDGTLEVFYKEQGGSWQSETLTRDPNNGGNRYSTLLQAESSSEELEIYLRLTVFGQCYYDRSQFDPYKITTKWYNNDLHGAVGNNVAMSYAIIESVPYVAGFVKYKLSGGLFVQGGLENLQTVQVGYQSPSGTVGSIHAAFDQDYQGVEGWTYSKIVGYGWALSPVPTYIILANIAADNEVFSDLNFGNNYLVSGQLAIY